MARIHFILSVVLLLSVSHIARADDVLPPLLTVSGTGESRKTPDEVSITVGVQLRNESVQTVSQETDDRSAAIISFLLGNGVADNDIQTSYVTLSPYYSWQSSQAGNLSPDYYTATKSITFLLKDLSRYDQIMSGLYDAGINSVSDVTFKISSDEDSLQEAKIKAVANAKSIADVLADGLGAKIIGVYSVSDASPIRYPQPIYAPMAKGVQMGLAMSAAADGASSGPSIAGGEVVSTSTINVSFYISNNDSDAN